MGLEAVHAGSTANPVTVRGSRSVQDFAPHGAVLGDARACHPCRPREASDEAPTAHRVYKLETAYRKVCESVGRPLICSLDTKEENVTNGEATAPLRTFKARSRDVFEPPWRTPAVVISPD